MKRMFFAMALIGALWTFGVDAHDTPRRAMPNPKLPAIGKDMHRPAADLSPYPYAKGTLAYRGEELVWFAVVERATDTVGVVILSHGRREFRYHPGEEVPFVIESFREGGQVLSYLMFNSTTCDRASLEDLTCEFAVFVKDVVAKLQLVPGFSKICVQAHVGMGESGQLPCTSER